MLSILENDFIGVELIFSLGKAERYFPSLFKKWALEQITTQ